MSTITVNPYSPVGTGGYGQYWVTQTPNHPISQTLETLKPTQDDQLPKPTVPVFMAKRSTVAHDPASDRTSTAALFCTALTIHGLGLLLLAFLTQNQTTPTKTIPAPENKDAKPGMVSNLGAPKKDTEIPDEPLLSAVQEAAKKETNQPKNLSSDERAALLKDLQSPNSTVQSVSTHLHNLSAYAKPAVVRIEVPRNGMKPLTGTGTIYTPDGFIITNRHVITASNTVDITFYNHQDKRFKGNVIGANASFDIAVIKINAKDLPKDLPTLEFEKAKSSQRNELVVAIGHPYGYAWTTTFGIISANEYRVITMPTGHRIEVLQTDAAINPGNSGGPVLNMEGKIIAITTAFREGASNTGFAVPGYTVQVTADGIIQDYLKKK